MKFRNEQKDIFGEIVNPIKNILRHKYGENPFSVLVTFSGSWLKRKREWLRIIEPKEGRKQGLVFHTNKVSYTDKFAKSFSTTSSVFDPVLCELMYRWFCKEGGFIFDPFAGESSKGIVAAILDYYYTGIEIREEQIKSNLIQLEKLDIKRKPNWILGNSLDSKKLLKGKKFDLVFTSPPYYNLEKYSKEKNDISNFKSYEDFMDWYRLIFKQSIDLLKEDRFLVVKVGEIRRNRGDYYGFVADNVKLFCNLGLYFYNDFVLYNTLGSLGLRTSYNFNKTFKIGRCHQNVLVFWKGDLKKIEEFAKKKRKEFL